MDILVLRDENERLKEQLARTQTALAESEEARQRLETIIVDMRREKFGAKSEKLRPDQFHLPLEDVEIAQGVLDAAQEKAAALIKGKSDGAPCPSNRNRGQPRAGPGICGLSNGPLALIVERARRFVEDKDPWVGDEGAGYRDALPLAAGVPIEQSVSRIRSP
jgi:hypothetical protein